MKRFRRAVLPAFVVVISGACRDGAAPEEAAIATAAARVQMQAGQFERLAEAVRGAGNAEAIALLNTAQAAHEAGRAAVESGSRDDARPHFKAARDAMRGAVALAFPDPQVRRDVLRASGVRGPRDAHPGHRLAQLEHSIEQSGNAEARTLLDSARAEREAAAAARDAGDGALARSHFEASREALRSAMELVFPDGATRRDGLPERLRGRLPTGARGANRLLERLSERIPAEQLAPIKAEMERARAARETGDVELAQAHRRKVSQLLRVARQATP